MSFSTALQVMRLVTKESLYLQMASKSVKALKNSSMKLISVYICSSNLSKNGIFGCVGRLYI